MSLDLPPLDVPPERAARIRRRGQRVFTRWSALGPIERTWVVLLEPVLAGTGGAALVMWAFAFVF